MRLIHKLIYESGTPSLTRTIAVMGFIFFIVVSLYLVIRNMTWGNYETFATITGGGGAATQVANKLINSKFNTPIGTYNKKDEVLPNQRD